MAPSSVFGLGSAWSAHRAPPFRPRPPWPTASRSAARAATPSPSCPAWPPARRYRITEAVADCL